MCKIFDDFFNHKYKPYGFPQSQYKPIKMDATNKID